MTTIETTTPARTADRRIDVGAALLALAGLGFVGNGVVFFIRSLNSDLLLEMGITTETVGVTVAEIKTISLGLFHYIAHLQIGISAFLIGSGIAIAALGWMGVRRGLRWSWWTAVVTFVTIMGLGMPAHYPWGLASIQHVGGAYVATVLFVAGAVLTAQVARNR